MLSLVGGAIVDGCGIGHVVGVDSGRVVDQRRPVGGLPEFARGDGVGDVVDGNGHDGAERDATQGEALGDRQFHVADADDDARCRRDQVDGGAEDSGEGVSGPRIAGSDVAYEDVSFSYGDVLAVDHASFELKEGTVTALVGPSGSGKSTLATLLARFNDPDSGRITLGGVDLKDIPSNELYKHVAFVLQDPQLLRISLRDNIALGKPGASYEEVREAARSAHILDVIEALPDGFETIYGSDQGLSGGQEQRIAIARALLIDAPVLILDEATAFTDPESEAEIQRALSTLVKGRTVLVIAHRPESIVGADRIIVVDRGRVVTSGTHDELLEQPLYRALWQHAPAQEA